MKLIGIKFVDDIDMQLLSILTFLLAATSETPSYALPPTPPSPTATALSHWVTAAKMVQQQQQRQMQQPQQVNMIVWYRLLIQTDSGWKRGCETVTVAILMPSYRDYNWL